MPFFLRKIDFEVKQKWRKNKLRGKVYFEVKRSKQNVGQKSILNRSEATKPPVFAPLSCKNRQNFLHSCLRRSRNSRHPFGGRLAKNKAFVSLNEWDYVCLWIFVAACIVNLTPDSNILAILHFMCICNAYTEAQINVSPIDDIAVKWRCCRIPRSICNLQERHTLSNEHLALCAGQRFRKTNTGNSLPFWASSQTTGAYRQLSSTLSLPKRKENRVPGENRTQLSSLRVTCLNN